MTMNPQLAKGISEQIVKELHSAYLYLQMAAWCETRNLKGFSNWFRVQAQEEGCHGLIFFNFLLDRGEYPKLGTVGAPSPDFKSMVDVFERTLAHEQLVTASINALVDLSIIEKDHASKGRLDWFVAEQVEEEANAAEILGKLKLLGVDAGEGLLQLDRVMAARTFVLPAPLAAGGAP